jgi:hypothetical protein
MEFSWIGTHLPTPKNGRVELLIYWRVNTFSDNEKIGLIYNHDE